MPLLIMFLIVVASLTGGWMHFILCSLICALLALSLGSLEHAQHWPFKAAYAVAFLLTASSAISTMIMSRELIWRINEYAQAIIMLFLASFALFRIMLWARRLMRISGS